MIAILYECASFRLNSSVGKASDHWADCWREPGSSRCGVHYLLLVGMACGLAVVAY